MTETTTTLTFEDGYNRLQQIAERLNQEDVPVSEMCDLFAEGKGLEQALTHYLDTQKARVEAIQKGEGVRAFTIAAGVGDQEQLQEGPSAIEEASNEPDASDFRSASGLASSSDDEIPF